MQSWRRMCRQRDTVRRAQRPDAQELGHPRAPRGVRLQYVNGSPFEHPSEVHEIVTVLAGGDIHARRRAITYQSHSVEIVRRYGLLEPTDAVPGETLSESERLFSRVRPICVDVELRGPADRLARDADALDVRCRFAADL